jgi:hypothetical protein
MTIKTQGGKVITKGGKVSCECCDPPPPECPQFITLRELRRCDDEFDFVTVYMENYEGQNLLNAVFRRFFTCWRVSAEFQWDVCDPPEGQGAPPIDFTITGDVDFFDDCEACEATL